MVDDASTLYKNTWMIVVQEPEFRESVMPSFSLLPLMLLCQLNLTG